MWVHPLLSYMHFRIIERNSRKTPFLFEGHLFSNFFIGIEPKCYPLLSKYCEGISKSAGASLFIYS